MWVSNLLKDKTEFQNIKVTMIRITEIRNLYKISGPVKRIQSDKSDTFSI